MSRAGQGAGLEGIKQLNPKSLPLELKNSVTRFTRTVFSNNLEQLGSQSLILEQAKTRGAKTFAGCICPRAKCEKPTCGKCNNFTIAVFWQPLEKKLIAAAVPVCDVCADKIKRTDNSPEFEAAARHAAQVLGGGK